MTRTPDAGFTLIETLVALVVLATSAVALLGATEAHVARIADLEARAAALWAAENTLAELRLGLALNDQPDPILGLSFVLSATYSATADDDLARVDVSAKDTVTGRDYAVLTGFLDTGATE